MTKEQIKDIAENLDCGFKCFVHRETKGIKFIPDTDQHSDMETDAWEDEIETIDNNIDDYIEIEGMESEDSFKLMEDFVDTIEDTTLQNKLGQALAIILTCKRWWCLHFVPQNSFHLTK